MEDLIRRSDAIDAVLSVIPYDEYWKEQVEIAVNNLPSAEQKKGKWVGHNADDPVWQRDDGTPIFLECSACQAFVINNGAANWNYCPNCGADMREKTNEQS